MKTRFTVGGRIARPVQEVFEAVVDPEQLSAFFTTGGASGRLEPGAVVTWKFHDFPGAFPVHVVEVEQDRRIVLQWDAAKGSAPPERPRTTVTFTFEQLDDGRTWVRITEEGWSKDDAGYKAALQNSEGWTFVICALKVWLEHGIRLRADFYK